MSCKVVLLITNLIKSMNNEQLVNQKTLKKIQKNENYYNTSNIPFD
jgi:hypothetical protein